VPTASWDAQVPISQLPSVHLYEKWVHVDTAAHMALQEAGSAIAACFASFDASVHFCPAVAR